MRARRPRLAAVLLAGAVAGASARARADERQYQPPTAPPSDVPRWRLRVTVAQGFGGSLQTGGGAVTRFPTQLELGARLWGPLSVDGAFVGTLAGDYSTACGRPTRPNAAAGLFGLRADLANGRSAGWVDPWVEVHAGVGAQAAARAVPGGCPTAVVFPGAGARAGFDAWLGRGAVTVAVSFDYLPVGSALSFVLGGSVVAF